MAKASLSEIAITFIMPGGDRRSVTAAPGLTVLDVARAHDIDIEGACGGAMACATCHVIVDEDFFERLNPISAEEDEMLDLAAEWTPTSRLGCQVKLSADHDGLVLKVPRSTMLFG